jgi:chaperonin GroES
MAFENRIILNSAGFKYLRAEWDGENKSGYEPLGDRVLVFCDVAPGMSEGGIIVEVTQEQQQMACETGVIVALGPTAFKWNADRMREFGGEKPEPGTRVYFERYAGMLVTGDDGLQYRSMDDKHIGLKHIGGGENGKTKPAAFKARSRDQ